MTIGQRIRAARLKHGWSQPQLAAEVGCSVSQLRKFEYLGDDPPVGSRFFDRTLFLLGITLAAAQGDAPELDVDTALTRASEMQLVAELSRRIAERAGEQVRTDQSNVAPIEVRGMRFDTSSVQDGPA